MYRIKFENTVAENKIGISSRGDRFVKEVEAVDFNDAMRIVRLAAQSTSNVLGKSSVVSDGGFTKDDEIEKDFIVDALGTKEWFISLKWTESDSVYDFAVIETSED